MNTKLYVGNLSFDASESDVRELFSQYGQVADIYLPMDRQSGRPRGFAFVTMGSGEAASAAESALNGFNWMGRNLAVNEARPQTDRPAYSGGGGGGGGGGRDFRGGKRGGGRY
ncbi:MAG: RNA-binding protein [Verrucomicrobiales bacterium]|nr:RNA-binding protein [Verrucomicrobiales bacterium]